MRDKNLYQKTKEELFYKLKQEEVFWSYAKDSVTIDNLDDDHLIALTMRHLDLDEIGMLFKIYSKASIKKAWKELLIPEGEYLYVLNRFFAWYYFDAKNPSAYVKSLQTRHFNRLMKIS